MVHYCDNISVFETFPGQKLLVTYDDLVTSNHAIAQIFSFLGIGDAFDASLMNDIRRESVAWYNEKQPSRSQTEGRPDFLNFHQSSLELKEIVSLWNYIRSRLSDVEMQHLSKWGIAEGGAE